MDETLSYEEVPVEILSLKVNNLRKKVVDFIKVLWNKLLVKGATREAETDMKSRYPHLFDN